mmetsp:Transcript_89134/g.270416  ORF Transcript_89134/g.270416 Transcript_89134/m.270416 type:complete len:209 (+) Transcript_89134:778-1404(+)
MLGEEPDVCHEAEEEDDVCQQHPPHLYAELRTSSLRGAELEADAVREVLQGPVAVGQREVPDVRPHVLAERAVDPLPPLAGGVHHDVPLLSRALRPLADILDGLHLRPVLVQEHLELELHLGLDALRLVQLDADLEGARADAVAELAEVLPVVLSLGPADPQGPCLQLCIAYVWTEPQRRQQGDEPRGRHSRPAARRSTGPGPLGPVP